MQSKRILIFGGGLNQLALIEAAKALGLTTVVIDPNPDAPGRAIADHFEVVPPKDYEHTKVVAQSFKVDGIVTAQMENPLAIMARLAEDMGYIFPSCDAIDQATDKWKMKAAFQQYGVPCAKGILLRREDDLSNLKESHLSYPLIIKPLNAFSSRGVYRVENEAELQQRRPQTEAFSKDGCLIVEEFLEGPEYSVEAITCDKQTTIVQYTEKFVTLFPYTVEMGHLQPADLSEQQQTVIAQTVKMGIRALGIDNTASHTEVKWTMQGPKIIEIGARLGGDFISSYLTQCSTGVDMNTVAIQTALGEPFIIHKTVNRYAYIKYFACPPGYLVSGVEDFSSLKAQEYIVFAHIFAQKNERIPELTHSAQRSGCALAAGESRADVIMRAEKANAWLQSKIKLSL